MKIVHVTSVHPWNDVRIYQKMCRSLARAGHEVHLVAPEPVAGAPRAAAADGISLHLVPRRSGRVRRVIGTARDAADTAIGLQADVLHFHDPELLPYFAGGSRRRSTRIVYDVHEDHRNSVAERSWAPQGVRQLLGWSLGWYEDLVSPRMSAIVTATPRIAERFRRHPLVQVIQNFPELEADPFASGGGRRPVPGRFAYIGVISDGRCIGEMIEAVAMLGTSATLDLAGHWERAGRAAECRKLPGWSRVRELGMVSRSEVFAMLTCVEAGLVLFRPLKNHVNAQPNKLFEYMLAGLPVIASDFPLWRALIEPEGAGLLVDPESTEAIAGAMRWMLAHPDEAAAMGRRGRAAVLERYNWQGEFTKLLTLYERLMI
ncbi:MAG: glycosyltransferase family 4 protein [Gemmatimonadota bacterium]